MKRFSKVRQLREIKLLENGVLKGFQTGIELSAQGAACSIAHHWDVHGNHIPLEGGVPTALDCIPKALPGSLTIAVHLDDLVLISVQLIDVHKAVEEPTANKLFQRSFRQALNVHGLFANEVDELAQPTGLAGGIIAEQRLGTVCLTVDMDTGRLATAGTLSRDHALQIKGAAVKVFLYMGDNHIPLGDDDPIAGSQLQRLDERQIMKARPGDRAAVNLHRIKDGNGRDLTGACGCPFNGLQLGFEEVIFKLECKSIFVMMSCAATVLGIGHVVVGHYDAVNWDIIFLCVILQHLDSHIQLIQLHLTIAFEVVTYSKAEAPQLHKAFTLEGKIIKALQNTERHEVDPALFADFGIQQSDRTRRQIAAILIRLTIAVHQRRLQYGKIAGSNERLTGHHQPPLKGDVGRDAGNPGNIMGNDFTLITVATGGGFLQDAVFVGQLDGQAVQFEHQQNALLTHESQQFLAALRLIQRKKRDCVCRFLQLAHGRIANRLCGRVAHPDTGLFFQCGQFIEETIIHLVFDGRGIEVVILMAIPVQHRGQVLYALIGGHILFHYATSSGSRRKDMIRFSRTCSLPLK